MGRERKGTSTPKGGDFSDSGEAAAGARGAARSGQAGRGRERRGRSGAASSLSPPPPQGPRRNLGGGALCLRRASLRRQRPSRRRGAYLSASRRPPAAAPALVQLSRSPSFPEACCAMALALAALAAVEPACGTGYQQVSGPEPAPPSAGHSTPGLCRPHRAWAGPQGLGLSRLGPAGRNLVNPGCQVGRGPEAELVALYGLRPRGISFSFSRLWFGVIGKSGGEKKILSQKGKGNGFRRKDPNHRYLCRRLSAARCDYSGFRSLVSVQTHPPRSL